jgi:phosphoglucomutase
VQVEVVDPVEDYLALLKEVFDFQLLRNFIARPDFSLVFDALHAVTGAYATPILVDALGAPPSSVRYVA